MVARDVFQDSTIQGGFGVVSVRYKVHAILAQWVRRYATAPNAWAYMMTFWLFDRFGVYPQTVLATLSLFLMVPSGLPAFYRALLRAWTTLHGSLSQAGLIVGSADTTSLRADSLTCKSCYQLLLSLNPAQPHCVVKFRSNYGDLDWDSTWKTLFFMPLDRKPIDLCWKVAHGVLYTAHCLVSFGLNFPPDCLCGAVGLIASIKGLLSFYLPLLFKRFRSRRRGRFFQHQWGANGRIGKVAGDSSFLSFLVWFKCVSLGRLCWLYCGLLGSEFFA